MGRTSYDTIQGLKDKFKYEKQMAESVAADIKRRGTDKGPDRAQYEGARETVKKFENLEKYNQTRND